MDDAKARKMFQAYLDNAEAKSGKTLSQMHAMLKKSGLKAHAALRDFAKREFGIGHGHAHLHGIAAGVEVSRRECLTQAGVSEPSGW